jgi:hypothetical protein
VDKKDWNVGFKWVVDSLRADHEHIASQIEIEWYATTKRPPTAERVTGPSIASTTNIYI